jgi:hypothetical protein
MGSKRNVSHKTACELGYYKCVVCNKRIKVRKNGAVPAAVDKVLLKDRHYVVCKKCTSDWVWYPGRKYLRMAKIQHKWVNQGILADTMIKIFGSRYVINEVKMIEWGISARGTHLTFDLAIPAYNILTDYMGIQHAVYPNVWHRTREEFDTQVRNDKLKSRLAKEQGWTYLVFSYNEPVGNLDYVKHRISQVVEISG